MGDTITIQVVSIYLFLWHVCNRIEYVITLLNIFGFSNKIWRKHDGGYSMENSGYLTSTDCMHVEIVEMLRFL